MRLTGRRESSNVEDRRGLSGGTKAGIGGIGGVIIIAIITLLSGGDLSDVVSNVVQSQLQGQVTEETNNGQAEFSPEEEEAATFSKQVLGSLEDVWTEQFKEHGMTYTYPTILLFTGTVQTACCTGSAQMGPFLLQWRSEAVSRPKFLCRHEPTVPHKHKQQEFLCLRLRHCS